MVNWELWGQDKDNTKRPLNPHVVPARYTEPRRGACMIHWTHMLPARYTEATYGACTIHWTHMAPARYNIRIQVVLIIKVVVSMTFNCTICMNSKTFCWVGPRKCSLDSITSLCPLWNRFYYQQVSTLLSTVLRETHSPKNNFLLNDCRHIIYSW